MRLQFFNKDGRKYACINGSRILMEGNIFDKVKDLCKIYFTKYTIKSNKNLDKPVLMIHVSRECEKNVEAFNVAISLLEQKICYDVAFL